MNTTEIIAETGKAPAEARRAPSGKRQMARTPSKPAAAVGTTNDPVGRSTAAAPAPSKIASVFALLEREQGATLAEIVEATGWQPHTTRAALTGLKKKGQTITKDKRGDVTCYCIPKAG